MPASSDPRGTIEETDRFTPRFGPDSLLPCITVDATSGDVLMFAWMNAEALQKTLATGFVHYWSRTRRALWKKGETSGAMQRVIEMRTDCDQDVILIRAQISDPEHTCHTGRPSCFYRSVPVGDGPIERLFQHE